MALLELSTHQLHYRVDGDAGPWVVFCNSLGTDLHMWDAQVEALSTRFRVLRYDRRGHGQSTAATGPYTLADLGGDVLALMDALEIERAHFCGLSIGGLVGQWLGIHAPERIERLVVCATAAKIGTAKSWNQRIALVQDKGLAPLLDATDDRWFTPDFIAANPDVVEDILARFAAVSAEGYAGCCAALAGADLRAQINRIGVPVLAISGDDDPVCTPDDLQAIADGVADGQHVSLPGRHIVNIESAEAFSAALADFLA
ncbi:3-oxoadipate enol-lactonase [Luteimonas qiangzhengi]|uniref:3-oxoadipate enol-lactonase n=1 Tax=Luteimonas sp. MJ146 TaxID=3129240 RepID=UPI0031BB030B